MQLLQEVRYARKQLIKSAGFSAVVILTLALSIGANTAIFSIVSALLLRPLPYPSPERLGTLMMSISGRYDGQSASIDRDTWHQLKDSVPAVMPAVYSMAGGVNLESQGHTQFVHGQRVSAHYFDVLGVRPLLGRGFNEAEDTAGGPNVVVLSNGLWKTTFSSDPNILGKAVDLKGVPYTVIGVLSAGTRTPSIADVFTSLRPDTSEEGGGDNYGPIFRLRDGATWEQANAQLSHLQSGTSRYEQTRFPQGRVFYYAAPLQQGLSEVTRTPAMILMAAVSFVLLVACANLAGLALVRVGQREPEIATRLALGANRWAILRQFWLESLMLTVLGATAALLLGNFILKFMSTKVMSARIAGDLMPVGGIGLDLRVLGFTAFAALGCSLLCGLLPALSTRRIDVRSALASGSSRSVAQSGTKGTRYALIGGEVALTVVLLCVAGLLVRTLIYLETLPPGFNPDNVIVAKASLDDARYSQRAPFLKLLDQSTAAMQNIPGVESAAVGLTVPYERALNYNIKIVDGPEAGKQNMTNMVYVTPGYLQTLQIPIKAGRDFAASDNETAQFVAIVNTTFARKYFGSTQGVGRHIESDGNRIEVVGMADSVVAPPGFTPGGPIGSEPTIYVPAAQMPTQLVDLVHVWFQPNWIVRTRAKTSSTTQQMQQAMASVDSNLPISGFYAMKDVLAETLLLQHVEVDLLATLSGLALLLSAVGIYGLVSNLILQRQRELGIRMALGCSVRNAMFEVSRSGIVSTAAGLVAGLLLSLGAVNVLRSQLYGVAVYDPVTIGLVAVVLALVAVCSALLPTFRIARIDPAETLRAQ